MEVSPATADSLAGAFRALPWVSKVELGTDRFRITSLRDSDMTSRVFTQIIPWGIQESDVLYVHSMSDNKGAGIKVSILDTGIYCTHPDLDGHTQSGYDYVNMTSGGGCTALHPHGTMVAGIIGAADDTYGVVGMAPEADLYSVRVCDEFGNCSDAAIMNGIHWARSNGIDVINLSIANCGSDLPSAIAEALEDAVEDDLVVVASAGNGVSNGCYPSVPVSTFGDIPEVIIVGAYFQGDSVNSGFQFGSRIDLAAPSYVLTDSAASSFGYLDGTSAATPHVSGAVALLLAAGVPPSQVRAKLTATARDLGPTGKDNYFGHGALDALSAVIPGPQVGTISHCTSGVVFDDCLITPTRNWGVPAFQWRFIATRNNGAILLDSTGWVSDSTFLVPVSSGEYEIQVDMWVREDSTGSPRDRVSNKATYFLQVCDDGIDALLAICPPTM